MGFIEDKIKQIKYYRLGSEGRFLMDIINNLTEAESNSLSDQNVLKYFLGDVVIFTYDRRYKTLWYNFDKVYLKLSFTLAHKELEEFLKYFINKNLIKEEILYLRHGSTRSSPKVWKQ